MEYNKAITMLGMKFYDPKELNFVIYRIMNVDEMGVCTCRGTDNSEKKIPGEDIATKYTRLTPDGIITFFDVSVKMSEASAVGKQATEEKWMDDVIVTYRTFENIKNNIKAPDMVCRQNATDLQYCMLANVSTSEFVGFCLTRYDIPENMPMSMLTQCDEVKYAINVNTYINDNEDTILTVLGRKSRKFDNNLKACLKEYMESKNMIDTQQKVIRGHCRSLSILLENNDFWYNMDQLNGIVRMKERFEDYTEIRKNSEGKEFFALTSDATNLFCNLFGKHISRTVVVRYDHDIDLSDIPKGEYFLFRDSIGDLYVVRFVLNGEFLKAELESEARAKAYEQVNIFNKYGKALKVTRFTKSN